jgi:hypothetical protein
MSTVSARLRSLSRFVRQAWLVALAEATAAAMDFGIWLGASRHRRSAVLLLVVLSGSLRPAQATAAGGSTCPDKGATGTLVTFFKNVGFLLYVIGGILFLVSLAWYALLFMYFPIVDRRGGKRQHGLPKKATKPFIGLALLAGGYFLRSIVVDLAASSGQVVAGRGDSGAGAQSTLTDCAISGQG